MPSREPLRMTLGNLDTGEGLTAQYNPTEVEVALSALFNKSKVPGQTYEEQQYANTANPTISFTLCFDGKGRAAPDLLDVEGFIFSLMYPPLDPTSISTGAPPGVIFSWPGWILLVTTMPKFVQKSTRFSPDGPPTYQTYKVELEGRLTRRIGAAEVRRQAMRRTA